jgi:hypothetical protein
MAYFYFKLLGPRPRFVATMTLAERELMDRHGRYWRELVDRDTALVFGLVNDPDEPFGVCVARAEDEPAARALRRGIRS